MTLATVMFAAAAVVQMPAAEASTPRDEEVVAPFIDMVDLGPVSSLRTTNRPFTAQDLPWYEPVNDAYEGLCRDYNVCFTTDDGFHGWMIRFGGSYLVCQGWRWEGSIFQDHTYSFWNRSSGNVSVWNRYADGSYRFGRLINAPRDTKDAYRFSYSADAWVYDPRGDCANLNLRHISS